MRTVLFVFTAFLIFYPSLPEAAEVPQYVVKKCQDTVRKANPVKITYNYGVLGINNSKSMAEISASCGENGAAGCFHAKERSCSVAVQEETVNMSGYVCSYDKVYLTCDFSGASVDLTNEYIGCNARAVLRHELQHFMNWKTAKENMLKELKSKLTAYLVQNVRICKDVCPYYQNGKIYDFVSGISAKWQAISDANDRRLDEVDHDYANQVNYTVCAPYSLEFTSY